MRAAVVGLGKLGAPLAAVLASKGHDVLGVDVNSRPVDLVNRGLSPVDEPGVQALVDLARGNLAASSDLAAAAQMDLSILLVPTPSDDRGAFSNEHVLAAVEAIGRGLAGRDTFHVVVVGSTVMPGSCEAEIVPALERASRRRVGDSLGLCYSPEFIALGSVVQDLLRPDMVLIGESDPHAGAVLRQLYSSVCENDPPVRRMNLVNAELTKIAVNTFVTMKISYANALADLCERLPGADVETITDALGLDRRVGPAYLSGAIAYGGPCFPRDNRAFAVLARDLDAEPLLAEATDSVNRAQVDRLARVTQRHAHADDSVGILGLTYKPGTTVIDESPGIELARALGAAGVDVIVYDPVATDASLSELGNLVRGAGSVHELLERCDVVVVATPWPEFEKLPVGALSPKRRPLTVIDCWRQLSDDDYDETVEIVRLGRSDAALSELPSVGVVST